MTSYIPSLTLPSAIFANPAVSILLPVALGTAVGFSMQRKPLDPFLSIGHRANTFPAKETQKSYMALKQPPYRAPPQAFGPVWTLLYGLMGFAAYRAYHTGLSSLQSPNTIQATKHGATLYTIQLGLNLIWMPLFFVAKRPIEATVDIVVLTGTVAYLTYLWGQVDPIAGWALAPYLAWLGYATYLSAGVGYLNDWNTADKEVDFPPTTKAKDTLYVDEKET
jgi:translocator protein